MSSLTRTLPIPIIIEDDELTEAEENFYSLF